MKNKKVLIMVEGAIMIALATVLSYIKFGWAWGGSITLLSMLPIVLFSIKRGVKWGLIVSFLYSLTQFAQGVNEGLFSWGLSATMLVACIIFDYILAFTVIGFAGMFRKKGLGGWITGIVTVMLIRFACHYISGVVIWKSMGTLWKGFATSNTYIYSLVYNGAYMVPEILFTTIAAVLLLKLPQVKKIVEPVKD
ncbi:MAG: proton-coupled thiamine transporter YuaJ [Clostridiales bacterium]|nr:proton-coupled thiamine transporter YuaJ [Clostridiales bacterium]